MKIVGIILEANPFHHGHQYFINMVKDNLKPDLIIAVLSTSFTMRGEVSIVNKFDKVRHLLDNQIDLVMELPSVKTVQSADYFCFSAVEILAKMGITDLAFGLEIDDLDKLYYYKNTITSNKFSDFLREELSKHHGHKNAYTNALIKYGFSNEDIDLFNSPNITLAIQYLRAIDKYNPLIIPHIIKRTNSYHEIIPSNNHIASATAIRNIVRNKLDPSDYLDYVCDLIDIDAAEKNYFNLLKFQYHVHFNQIENIFSSSDGIQNYIKKSGNWQNDLFTLIDSLKCKGYTINHLMRIFFYSLIILPKQFNYKTLYLRILGFNENGLGYLSTIPKEIKKLIFSNIKESFDQSPETQLIAEYELKTTKLYSQISNNNELELLEYQLPIRKVK